MRERHLRVGYHPAYVGKSANTGKCRSGRSDDLQAWLNRLVPENDSLYTHTQEGPDDMPAHIKSALTAVNLSIPLMDGKLGREYIFGSTAIIRVAVRLWLM